MAKENKDMKESIRTNWDDESSIKDPRIQHLSYIFEETGESIPYALFVPSSYKKDKQISLIVSLHGLTRTYDWLMGYEGLLDLAEEFNFIVVTSSFTFFIKRVMSFLIEENSPYTYSDKELVFVTL